MSLDETAAAWRLRLLQPNVSALEHREFQLWLDSALENRAAYQAMEAAWEAAGAQAVDPEIIKMREAALRFEPPRGHPAYARLALAAAAILFVSGLWWTSEKAGLINMQPHSITSADLNSVTIEHADRGEFATRVGERSTLRLIDSSVVTLDTASRVSIDMTGRDREVHLLAGRANFEVAKDPMRPFVVYAADRRITAVGTAFDVLLAPNEVRVTLVEGKVAVDQLATTPARAGRDAPVARTKLEPGEQLIAPVGGAARVSGANLERSTSWREGRLVFVTDRLADAIAEMNRYSPIPIVLADPAIGELKVSGVFSTGNPRAFSRALTEYFNVDAADEANATVLRWRR